VNRLFEQLQPLLKRISEVSLLALAALTFVDVLGRYVFSFPVPGSVELTEMLMVALVFCGISLATAARAHVVVDVLALTLGDKARRVQAVFAHLLATGVCLLFAFATWQRALSAHDVNEQTTVLSLPLAPMVYFMSILLFVNALGHAGQLWASLMRRDSHA
jgi:TRAP-type C4-dicarboxylate transport system permease small subunit